MIQDPQHGLVWGDVDLLGSDRTGPYHFETVADGVDFGNPEQVFRTITSMLQDGEDESVDSWGNREMTFPIKVVAESAGGLEQGGQALEFEASKQRNTLTWTPPDKIVGSGTPNVYDIVRADLQFEFDDLDELRLERRYTLTLRAAPWVHAEQPVEVPSLAPSSGTTLTKVTVDSGASTSGWSAVWAGLTPITPTTTGGAVLASWTNTTSGNQTRSLGLRRSGLSVSMTATPYVRIDWTTTFSGAGSAATPGEMEVFINGVRRSSVAKNGSVSWYLCPSSTLTSVEVRRESTLRPGGTLRINFYDISRSNLPADSNAGQRQTFRTFPMQGTVRTPGNLALSDASAGLGTVIVYTSAAGTSTVQPPLREYRVAGSTETTDVSVVSGKRSDLSTLHSFDIPAPNVDPGGYLLVARVRHATAGARAITWAGMSRMGSTTLDAAPQSGVRNVTLAANTWTVVSVAQLNLPPTRVGPNGMIRINLSGPSGLELDEAWLFNVDTGRLTIVECGTGTPTAGGAASRLWLDAASLENPERSIWLGTAADRSDAFGAGGRIQSFGRHEFVPPLVNAFVVATGSVATDVLLSYFPSYSHHVVAAA